MDTANQAGKNSEARQSSETPATRRDNAKDDLKEKVEACEEIEKEEEKEEEEEVLPDAVQLGVAAGGALLVGLLYLLLPEKITLSGVPSWLPLALEAALVTPSLVAVFLLNRRLPYRVARGLALALLGVLTLVLVISVAEFILALTYGYPVLKGPNLLRAGALLWVINILVFAVWYWEIDGGGPRSRLKVLYLAADLLFPQQQQGNPTHWVPGFIDYLFVAFCFSTALSPADTAPLTRRAKALMMAQAAISLTIIVLLVGRSVNILPAPQ